MNKDRRTGFISGNVWLRLGSFVLLALLMVVAPVGAEEGIQDELEALFERVVGHQSGMHYTWYDEAGDVVTMTAIEPMTGDTYIDGDNRLWEVVSVSEDRTVETVFKETIRLPEVTIGEAPVPAQGLFAWLSAQHIVAAQEDAKNNVVGIYHSHNAESYLESSGEEFIEPHGEVVDVGGVLAEALEEQGLRVIHSDASHLPHDGGAYQRSRATVRELLEQDAVALIDVHRDAIPAEEYEAEVDGEPMTRIRIVVGRQNPNREANLELAQRIKAIGDEQYPGLIKGIFHASGNYNQDVGPRMILLEFGTHETSAADAAKSAQLFAEIYPAAAGLTPDSAQGAARQLGGAGWRSAFWVALIAAAAIFGFVWMNEGSPQAAWQRIRTFFQREAGKVRTSWDDSDGDIS